MSRQTAFLDRPRTVGPWDTTIPQPPTKRLRSCNINSSHSTSSRVSASVRSLVTPVTWTVNDIAKAANILDEPPVPVEFADEQEMRRVYSLIYDVFRYKTVLNQALVDIQFFFLFPENDFCVHHVWLLLYDLYHRRFKERDIGNGSAAEADRLFPTCKLNAPEAALWATRVRLAAAMSRLRIANSALRLSDMLPEHLKDERLAKGGNLANVTCWVNKSKIGKQSPEQFFDEIKQKFLVRVLPNNSKKLGVDYCRWDPLCPMFLAFHHSKRQKLAQSDYARQNILILLNRSFCYGPAVLSKLLFQHNLTGLVIQTHVNSPRATAYLATLLSENDQIIGLYAFGAGERKEEYELYLKEMSIKNVKIFAQKFTDLDVNSNCLSEAVAVFATPPNSYSAVNDPIDLVCSRGGDLEMLQILTDTAQTDEGQKRVQNILEEQRLTLRFAMTRPQIQFVLYETHSLLSAENEDMIKQVKIEINRAAKYKYGELEGKFMFQHAKSESTDSSTSIEFAEINNNENFTKGAGKINERLEMEESESKVSLMSSKYEEELLNNIQLPATDEFEEKKIPDLCFNSDQCLRLVTEGCYLALLERKEVTRFDAKYMIRMAEARGLFGEGNDTEISRKNQKTPRQRKKEANASAVSLKRKRGSFEVDRIAAPTHASVMRCVGNLSKSRAGILVEKCCAKHSPTNNSKIKESPAKLWWAETTRYLTRLRKSLIKQKLVTKSPAMLRVVTNDKIMTDIKNIDELLNCVERNKKGGSNIPVFPKLRLTREQVKLEKKPFPIFIKTVELPWEK